MAKTKTILIPAILCAIAIVAYISLKSMGHVLFETERDEAESGNTPPPIRESDSREQSLTKLERQDQSGAKALRELEIEFDEILPAKFPEQFSSLSDATLAPGEKLFLGGFRTADGNYEFTMLEADPIKADGTQLKPGEIKDAPLQYMVNTKTFVVRPEASSEFGLGSLISPAKTRIQKSVVSPSDETLLRPDNTVGMMTNPSLTLRPDTAASISVGTEKQARVISMIVSPGDTAESIRIRTRVETPIGQ